MKKNLKFHKSHYVTLCVTFFMKIVPPGKSKNWIRLLSLAQKEQWDTCFFDS
ncbi:MAG: hypothetical protein HUU50_07535 [Candidatus Brocadiae bacterium]|nr:hypothetical protein [Candidatus Brocadiia bacterium]